MTSLPIESSIHQEKYNKKNYVLIASLFLFFIGLNILVYGPGGDDDSHITYTAAKNLLETGYILNNNGEWVEQGSSLLHVILLAGAAKLTGLSVVSVGPIFSLLFGMLCFPLCLLLANQLSLRAPYYPVILLSLSISFSYWSMGGLEATLFASTSLLLIIRLQYNLISASFPFKDSLLWIALLAFVSSRPESPFVLFALFITAFVLLNVQGYRQYLRPLLFIMIMAAITCIILFSIRFYLFDALFPQPVAAKSDGLSLQKITFGFLYFLYATQLTLIIYVVTISLFGILILFGKLKTSINALICLSFCVAYLCFIIASGGDWMTGGRFFVPVIAPLACLFCLFLQNYRYFQGIVITMTLLCVIEIAIFSLKLSSGLPFYEATAIKKHYAHFEWDNYEWSEHANLVNIRDIPFTSQLMNLVEATLNNRINELDPLIIASIQMGMQPYHLRKHFKDQVYVIDMRGLSTTHITSCKAFDNTEKKWAGVDVSYKDYFHAMAQCDLPRPDIIYDLLNRGESHNRFRLNTLIGEGYHIVYQQQGQIDSLLGLKSLPCDAFIAVTESVYLQLPKNLKSHTFNFNNF